MLFSDEIRYSNQIAVKDDKGNYVSYQQLYHAALNMEEYSGKRVLTLIYCDNSFENLTMVLKLLFLGQPMLLLSKNSDILFRNEILEKFQPFYVWEKNELKKVGEKDNVFYKIYPELALLLCTSGTIGRPKLARISYRNITEEMQIGIRGYRIYGGQKGIQVLPIEHVYGLAFSLYHWSVGGCVVTTDAHVISSQFDDLYDKEEIQNIIGIPFHYSVLLKKGFWQDRARISRLNCAMVGGAKLDESERDALISLLQKRFVMSYGQTESTAAVVLAMFQNSKTKPGTIGRAVPGVKARVDEKDELYIESPTVCMGYASDYKDLGKEDENNGIIATGDLASIDEDGYIFLKGRTRRFVKILGNRIGLDELEILLSTNIPGHEFACTGEDDAVNVFFKQSDDGNLEEMCRKVLFKKAEIPLSMVTCHYIEEFPRSNVGKILYSALQ